MEINVKPGKTTQISSNYTGGTTTGSSTSGGWVGTSTNYGTTYTSYSNVGVGSTSTGTGSGTVYGPSISTQGTYKPFGYDEGSTMVGCVNCDKEVFAGEEYCSGCGKSTTEYEEP